jgi:hypothetical protein
MREALAEFFQGRQAIVAVALEQHANAPNGRTKGYWDHVASVRPADAARQTT